MTVNHRLDDRSCRGDRGIPANVATMCGSEVVAAVMGATA